MNPLGPLSKEQQIDQQARRRLLRRARSHNRAVAVRALEALWMDYYGLRLPLEEARLGWTPDGEAAHGR